MLRIRSPRGGCAAATTAGAPSNVPLRAIFAPVLEAFFMVFFITALTAPDGARHRRIVAHCAAAVLGRVIFPVRLQKRMLAPTPSARGASIEYPPLATLPV